MKCQKTKQLNDYLEDQLSVQERKEFEVHLENCLQCHEVLDSMVEDVYSVDTMAEEELLKEPITGKIIERLPDYPLGILKLKTIEEAASQMGRKKRGFDLMKKSALALASIAAVVAMGIAVSPSFAAYVTGLYASTTKNVSPTTSNSIISTINSLDLGAKQAAHNGFAHPLSLTATDQGITLEIKEILADPLRIIIAGVTKDKDGKYLEEEFQSWNGEITFKNKDGKILNAFYSSYGEREAESPMPEQFNWYKRNFDDYQVLQRQLNNFFNDEHPMPDEFIVEFNVTEIKCRQNGVPTRTIKGNWNFKIPVDMKKAKNATKTVEINQQYTTPQGTTFAIKEMKFAPSGTLLAIETNIKGGLDRDMYSFQILDEKGAVAASWDDVRSAYPDGNNGYTFGKNVIRLASDILYNTNNETTFFTVFSSLNQTGKYTLRFAEINKQEKTNFKTPKLTLESLAEKPVTVEQNGSTITFGKAELKKDKYGNEEIVIDIKGILGKDIVEVEGWKAVDEHGVERGMNFSGKNSKDDKGNVVMDGKLSMDTAEFKIHDGESLAVPPDKEIKELMIQYLYQRKIQPGISWEVPLQPKK
ncbi:DUF4179 domain-containing protein [Brevibacillus formosus]|uniref:DUF4179 domain-containing protein n=3 Tax=Brevibacillus TaxID=55080 RepID=UPI002E1EBEDE|nr:DUF4179 domain-containing protein [Brevibacillus formosus]MED2001568.1 DUF4179 domain-containing protein [Brevibacillus formosus]MED2085138.1 DUF4179 domain-containing protein [Brevibacillus formosus]